MDTSKDYYDSVMRDFKTYGRGRTLEQFCRDEGADFKWIEKAKELYGVPTKAKTSKTEKKGKTKSTDMIQLHFEPEPTGTADAPAATIQETQSTETEPTTVKPQWRVASLKVYLSIGVVWSGQEISSNFAVVNFNTVSYDIKYTA